MPESDIVELHPGIFLLRGRSGSSHSYLLRGEYKNILVDSGADSSFPELQSALHVLGLKIRDIDILINTHEHFDHIGANRYFEEQAIIAAHRFAATKMTVKDCYVTLYESGDLNAPQMKVHLWLEDNARLHVGNLNLDVFHTPGHTSGSICLLEAGSGFLFTGDTVFADGTLSCIAESGSVGDYINSLRRLDTLRVATICPGHGELSKRPHDDIAQALAHAMALLSKEGPFEVAAPDAPPVEAGGTAGAGGHSPTP